MVNNKRELRIREIGSLSFIMLIFLNGHRDDFLYHDVFQFPGPPQKKAGGRLGVSEEQKICTGKKR